MVDHLDLSYRNKPTGEVGIMTTTVQAQELQVGDVYHIKSDMAARIETLETVGKQISALLIYVTDGGGIVSVGTGVRHAWRPTTRVKITRTNAEGK